MRARFLVRSLAAFGLATFGTTVFAQEPLFLRIHPNSQPEAGVGTEHDEASLAARVRAERETVWERSDRRARIAIASICKGCLKAQPQDITVAASPTERPSREGPTDLVAQADATSDPSSDSR